MITEPSEIVVIGAGGKMGGRVARKLASSGNYVVRAVESDAEKRDVLRHAGFRADPILACSESPVVCISAVPDNCVAQVAPELVASLSSGSVLIMLDPAASHCGIIPLRDDVDCYIIHPCHPCLFSKLHDNSEPIDWAGGETAAQSVVCALHHGGETNLRLVVSLAKEMFSPVETVHVITTAQMAMLEPGLVEIVAATCIDAIRESLAIVVAAGVPEAAARDFLLGHLRLELAQYLGFTSDRPSEGAMRVLSDAKSSLFQDDWQRCLGPENIMRVARLICRVV